LHLHYAIFSLQYHSKEGIMKKLYLIMIIVLILGSANAQSIALEGRSAIGLSIGTFLNSEKAALQPLTM
jgi:hypothetical protein